MKKRAAALVLVLSMCFAALTGCSSSIAERKTDESKTLYVGYVGSSFPASFMPWLSRDGIAPTVASMIYNTLFSYDEETGDFAPLIARRWCYVDLEGEPLTEDGTWDTPNDYDAVEAYYSAAADDYMVVRVELFDDIHWTDGERLTVEDVYYSFDVATDNALSNHAGALAWTADLRHESSGGELVRQGMFTAAHPDLSGTYTIREGEEDTVMYLLVNKVFGAVTTLFNTILILPEHIWKPLVSQTQQLNNKNPQGEFLYQYEHPVGSGPWMLDADATNSQMIVLERNPDYHLRAEDGGPLYKADRIKLLLYLDSNTAIFALRKGYIDVLDASISTNYLSLMEQEDDIDVFRAEGTYTCCMVLNVDPDPPFDEGMKQLFGDARVRRAIALAIDQQELVDKVLDGAGATASAGLILRSNDLLYEPASDILAGELEERLAEANAILDELYPERDAEGYRLADGQRISFEILAPAAGQDLVAYLASQLRRIGIEATESVIVAEFQVAAVDFLQCGHRHGIVRHHVCSAHNGTFHILSQFLARADLHIGGHVVEAQTFHFLDVGPFLIAVDELLGELAGHTVGVFFTLTFNDIGIVTHTAFQTLHDLCIVSVEQGIDSKNDIFFDVHSSTFLFGLAKIHLFTKLCINWEKYSIFAAAKSKDLAQLKGDLAHLVERQVRNLKVAGSSPVISTESRRKPLK